MVELADTLDSGSSAKAWGFKSPSGHFLLDQIISLFLSKRHITQLTGSDTKSDISPERNWYAFEGTPSFHTLPASPERSSCRRSIRAFAGVILKQLNPGHIRDWMTWATEKGLGPRRINAIVSSMRLAVRYAVSREDLDHDPFLRIKEATESPKEKGGIAPGEVAELVNLENAEPRARLGILLGALCGLRRGKVRGLEWRNIDLDNKVLHICQNYLDDEGVKTPKRGSVRIVPIPTAVRSAVATIGAISPYLEPEDFVIFCVGNRARPIDNGFLRAGLAKMLIAIEIPVEEQKARNLTFHGLRHSFVTLGRMAGISDLEIQMLAGHRSHEMMDHYNHVAQVIDYVSAREKL